MKKLSVKKATVMALKKLGSASVKSITSYTKKPYAQVATELWRLKKNGEVVLENGVYMLSGDNKSKPTKTPKTIKLPKTAPVPVKLEDEPVKFDLSEALKGDELVDALSNPTMVMAKYLDSLAVIRYLEAKLAQRNVNA